MYRLKTPKELENTTDYITPTQRKYFKYALDYAVSNKVNECKVNKVAFKFDFDNKVVFMKSTADDRFYKHDLIEV